MNSMENPSHIYPTRSFIKFAARSQLIANLTGQVFTTFVQRHGHETSKDLISPEAPLADAELADAELLSDESRESTHAMEQALDNELFRDITNSAFHPEQHPELYEPCASVEMAADIENQIAAEIVETYQTIKCNQKRPMVQSLNALL
ncbi:MAG: hypothetical protein ACFE0I_02635 [Elainellaceae cyanobacterium]